MKLRCPVLVAMLVVVVVSFSLLGSAEGYNPSPRRRCNSLRAGKAGRRPSRPSCTTTNKPRPTVTTSHPIPRLVKLPTREPSTTTRKPTRFPTRLPDTTPPLLPTNGPTTKPTRRLTDPPTRHPTHPPTQKPTTYAPTSAPVTPSPTGIPATRAPTTSSPTTTCPGVGATLQYGGHLYTAARLGNLTWQQAYDVAKTFTCCGGTGHLATIKDAAENDFIRLNLGGVKGWIGLKGALVTINSDDLYIGPPITVVQFSWVTNETVSYTNWNPGEPNNAGGFEMCTEIFGTHGGWNDMPCNGERGEYRDAFIIEYDCTN